MKERASTPGPRRLGRCAALALLAAVLGLEAVLQVGALVVWAWHEPTSAGRGADPTDRSEVVCLGDSFTFGAGASTPDGAYPAVLERRLRAAVRDSVKVVNMGWPGSDSRDVVRRLPRALELEPDVVCVLIGCNDRWRRPPATTSTEAVREGFRWELRTLRLLRILIHGRGLFDSEPADGAGSTLPPSAGPVGTWQAIPADTVVHFDATGTCVIGPASYRWRLEAASPTPNLVLTSPGDVRPTHRFGLERREPGWLLHGEDGQDLALIPIDGSAPESLHCQRLLAQAEAARTEGDRTAARDHFRAVLEHAAALEVQRGAAAVGLLQLGSDSGLGAAEREQLAATLRAEAESPDADPRQIAYAVTALSTLGRPDAALDFLDKQLACHRKNSSALHLVGVGIATSDGRLDEALERAGHALAAARRAGEPREKVWRAALRATSGIDQQTRWLARARADLGAGDAAWWADRLRQLPEQADPGRVLDGFHQGGLRAEAAQGLLEEWRLASASGAGDRDWLAVLELHLEHVRHECSTHGARLVVLTYPFETPGLQDTLRTWCMEHDVACADMRGRFPSDPAERSELFVADGHCSDAGYALMAGEAFYEVADLLSR